MSAYIFDTELTDRKEGEIIEAAWLRLLNGHDLFGPNTDTIPADLFVDQAFECRYKPVKETTCGALAIHHILPSELVDCPPTSEFVLPADAEYLIGHSIDTDWKAAGSPAHVKRICTHAMSQHEWPEATGYSQVALLYMLWGATPETRLLVRGVHCAAADVQLNRLLLRAILKGHPEITTWSALWAYSEECRIPLYCPLKRWEGVKLDEMDNRAINWCLDQHWLDPYFRIGLERVMEGRYPPPAPPAPVAETPAIATVSTVDEDDELPF